MTASILPFDLFISYSFLNLFSLLYDQRAFLLFFPLTCGMKKGPVIFACFPFAK